MRQIALTGMCTVQDAIRGKDAGTSYRLLGSLLIQR